MTPVPYMLGPNFQELNRLQAANEFELHAQIRNTLRLLRPQDAEGASKVRCGALGQKGFVQIDDFEGIDVALVADLEVDCAWDRDLADRGIAIKPILSHGWASAVSAFDHGLIRPNMLLRIDSAGDEWNMLDVADLESISRFAQITCKFHDFSSIRDLRWRQRCFKVLRKLAKTHAPVHVHAHNGAGTCTAGNVTFPEILEVTYANRALYTFVDSNKIFPTLLDSPTDSSAPDLFLGDFRYEATDPNGCATAVHPLSAELTHHLDEWQIRARAATDRRRRLLSFGDRAVGILVSTNFGPMIVDPEDSSVGAALLQHGTFADHEVTFAASLINPNGTVMVVGAHIGAHVVRLAKCCKKLIAVEANPNTFPLLQANIALQGCCNVELINIAAGEKKHSIEFLANRDNTGGSKRRPINEDPIYFYDDPEIYMIPCDRLDDVIALPQIFDLVFMDIEGSEYFALVGMQNILKDTKCLSIEFLIHHIRNVSNVSVDDLFSLISPHFSWMYVPDFNELIEKNDMLRRLREFFESGQQFDCLYFLKDRTIISF